MYLNLGQSVIVHQRDVIGIFDLDNTSASFRTRKYLEKAEREGRVKAVFDDLPKAFVVCRKKDGTETVYLTQLSSAALKGRAERNSMIDMEE